MADSKRVELILGIRTEGAVDATAGIESISKVASELKGNLSSLERADVLKQLGATAATVAVQTGELDRALLRLATELKSVGATEKEIRKVSAEFDRVTESLKKTAAAAEKTAAAEKQATRETVTLEGALTKIDRADSITKLATKYGEVAKKTRDATAAAAQLNAELKKIDATESEIQGAAATFNQAQTGGNGPGGNLLQRLGAQGRNLPSVQIPGAGIGTDAISNLTRLAGALGEASGAAGLITSTTIALTPALGATAAAFAGVATVLGPIVVIAAVVIGALKSIGDQAAAEAKAINAIVEGQRTVAQEIAAGLTTEEAQEKIKALNAEREAEAAILEKNKRIYAETVDAQDVASRDITRLLSGAEEELATQIAKSEETLAKNQSATDAYTRAIENNETAANDAAIAEEKLAQERSKTALTAADIAGKELAAQQKALAATGEQNEKRLKSIEDEKAVIEAQIASLESSGVTSEEVTAKIEALNAQLGSLGKESEFISGTALAQSKARDAEKQAAKDAEDASKKAQQAQEQYTKSVQSAKTAYTQAVQDIGTRLKQTLADNTTKLNRDLLGLDTKFKQEEFDLALKSNRDARNAALKQADDIESIRRQTDKEEKKALEEGDFKALFLARQKGEEELQAQKEGDQKSQALRQLSQQDAAEDLRRNIERQREQRLQAARYQEMDARQAQSRELQQAQLARNRSLQAAAEAQNASLSQMQAYWKSFLGLQQQALGASTKGIGGSKITKMGISGGLSFGSIERVMK